MPSPDGDATRTARYANASRLRRETLRQRWTHMQRLYIEVLITVLVLSPTVLVYAFESAVITNY